jgi:AAHS family 4-hydroxybenzoate transporter-like MFS transporter
LSTEATGAIDVGAVIDRGAVHRWHIGLFALCAACMIMDGFDVQALGYVAPAIIREWHIAPALLTPVFAASNFGVLFGQLLFTMLADKVGRRPVLIGGTLAFSLLVIATGFSRTLTELLLLRFIAGLALGSIIPNATALVGEFSPARVRIRFVTYIGIGFTLGAAFGGFVAAWLIPTYGWPSVFFVGGVAPLIVAGAMTLWLPESLQLLALAGKRRDDIAKWLKKIDPDIAVGASTPLVVREEHKQGVPVGHLFGARTPVTLLLWLVFFLNLFNLYALANCWHGSSAATGSFRSWPQAS